jgi:hypothetical protein
VPHPVRQCPSRSTIAAGFAVFPERGVVLRISISLGGVYERYPAGSFEAGDDLSALRAVMTEEPPTMWLLK